MRTRRDGSFSKKAPQLLGHLNRLIVLLLRHSTGVQQLLHLLARVTAEHPLKLLEPLNHVVHALTTPFPDSKLSIRS